MSQRLAGWLFFIAIGILPAPLSAAVKNWNDGSDNWSNGANWTPAGVPGAGDTANIVFADDVARTVTYDYTGPGDILGPLTVDMTGAGTNATTLSMSANTLTTSDLQIGKDGRGAFTLGGGTLVGTAGQTVGGNGTGSLSQSSGANSAGYINIGSSAGSSGTYTINGGTASFGNVYVGGNSIGAGGSGVFSASGSSTIVTVTSGIKNYSTAGTSFNLQGATLNTPAIDVGGSPSLFSWTSGTLNITSDVTWDSAGAPNSTSTLFGNSLSLASSRTLKVAGNETIGGNGVFNLSISGGTHSVTGNITLKPGGSILVSSTGTLTYANFTQAGGTISTGFRNTSNYTYQSGTVPGNFINDGTMTIGSSLTISGTLQNDTYLAVGGGQSLNATSGITNVGNFALSGGTIGTGGLTNSVGGLLTAHGTVTGNLVNHGTMEVDGVLTLQGATINNDGVLEGSGTVNSTSPINNSAGGVLNAASPGGTLVIGNFQNNNAGGVINVGPTSTLSLTNGWTNSGVVNLQGAAARLSGGTISNNGTVQGFGTIAGTSATSFTGIFRASGGELDFSLPISNPSTGQFQAVAGSTLMFVQGMTINSGTVSLTGGTLDNNGRTLSNLGTINGYGTLRTGGFTNTPGKLLGVGGGDMEVFGAVTNNGVISIQGGRSAYFFNNVSGAGSFTGTGTAVFLASLSPGSSAALVNFAGGASLNGATSLNMELAGKTPGTEYDQIHVTGQLALGGVLTVTRIGGFIPGLGDSFDLLDWGSLTGSLSSLSLPTLAVGQWDSSQLYTNGVLTVISGVAGDYNNNGVVDAADYVLWRKGGPLVNEVDAPGTVNGADYTEWRARFGNVSGSGSGATSSASAVPEPAAIMTAIVAALSLIIERRYRRNCA